jgi:hypothetical protein
MKLIQEEVKKRENFIKEKKETRAEAGNGNQKSKWDFKKWIIISTSSKWKKSFDFLIVLLALYSTYSSTYMY